MLREGGGTERDSIRKEYVVNRRIGIYILEKGSLYIGNIFTVLGKERLF